MNKRLAVARKAFLARNKGHLHDPAYYAPYIPLFVTKPPAQPPQSQSGKCPKCGSYKLYREISRNVLRIDDLMVQPEQHRITCASCGWFEIRA